MVKFLISFTLCCLCCLTRGHLLPEDSLTDNEEQLNREKRDNFLDSILKTIPFFNPTSAQQEEYPVDPNDVDDEEPIFNPTQTSSVISTSTNSLFSSDKISSSELTTGVILSSTVVPSPTQFSSLLTSTMPLSTSLFSSMIALNSSRASSSMYMTRPLTSLHILSSLLLPSSSYALNKTAGVSMTIKASKSILKTPILSTYPSAKSIASIFPSASIERHYSSMNLHAFSTSPADEVSENVIKMMIVPAEVGVLPNEKGYGDPLGNGNEADKDMKNIKYIYRNVLIPIMSGIFGALIITFAIIIYKCIRRRKLQKMRYYGGKPDSGLYRLDHMSLLSDSSDEE